MEPLANLLRTRSKKEGQKIQAEFFRGLSKKDAMEAASHIVIDDITSNSELRSLVKLKLERFGKLRSKLKKVLKILVRNIEIIMILKLLFNA